MSILTGPKIKRLVDEGILVIEDFDPTPSSLGGRLNPGSYDLRLGNSIATYGCEELWYGAANNGLVTKHYEDDMVVMLRPGTLYLAYTREWTETPYPYHPIICGKSSIARLGIKVHLTAGFGDPGFRGRWTLEMEVTKKVHIPIGVSICQIVYHTCDGPEMRYEGRYQDQAGIEPYRPR